MQKHGKRMLSLLLTVLLLCTAAPLTMGAEDGYKIGDVVAFGSYPQTRVTDEALIADLEEAARCRIFPAFRRHTASRSGYPPPRRRCRNQ